MKRVNSSRGGTLHLPQRTSRSRVDLKSSGPPHVREHPPKGVAHQLAMGTPDTAGCQLPELLLAVLLVVVDDDEDEELPPGLPE